MELRLSKFITACEKIADIHNQDHSNPVLFNIPHPERVDGTEPGLKGQFFRMATSRVEPLYVGLPLNGIWVCMKPQSPYYRQCLKLKSVLPPETSGVAGAITDDKFTMSWTRCRRYEELFNEQQTSGEGAPGPDGRKNIIHKGNWLSTVRYKRSEAVMCDGSFWVSTVDENNVRPAASATQWQRLASVGDDPVINTDYIDSEIRRRLDDPVPQT